MTIKTDPNFTLRFNGAASEVDCPRCGSSYLHHGAVTLFDRNKEDGPVLVRQFDSPSPTLAGNPSGRRGGIAISFECEVCGDGIELTIAQHKGNTEMAWRYTEKRDESR